MNRIPADNYGSMGNIEQVHIKLISSMFVIGKVLIVKILMNPSKMGIPVKFTEKIILNFRFIASIIYHNFLEYVEIMTQKVVRARDQPGNDGISNFLIPVRELRQIFMQQHMEFRTELFSLYEIIIRKLYLLIINTDANGAAEGGFA